MMNKPKKKPIKKRDKKAKEIYPPGQEINNENSEEITSAGSADAFEQTEEVTEDNFDRLDEK